MFKTLAGVIPPVPTILDDKGQFDPEGMGILIERLIDSAVNGFLFLGSAGEFANFSQEQRKAIAEFCVEKVNGRKPVIIGTASCSTAEAIALTQHAADIGADAVMIVNPYYALMSDERLYNHYKSIADAVAIPQLLYNFPALTGQNLSVELIGRLADSCANIVGIKDTVDCMSHIRQVITEVKGRHPNFLVFCGFDEYALDTLLLGGDGVIPATSNFAPEITCGIYQAFLDKDMVAVQALLRRLAVLSKIYTLEVPFTGLIKEAIRLTGSSISAAVSAPATPPSPEMKRHLIALLREANIAIGE